MKISNLHNINGVILFEAVVHKDERGWFTESYNSKMNLDNFTVVQENHSYTKVAFTFRGFHHQKYPYSQDKLVRCIKGKILDIVIDLRQHSSTYLKSSSIELSETSNYQLYIPNGCLHGFLTLTDDVEVIYKVNQEFVKESEISMNPLDPSLIMVDWKNYKVMNLSEKDRNGNSLSEIIEMGV